MYDLVIFDLDGTLLDTSKGIYGSVRYAESVIGVNPIDEKFLKVFLGPPPSKVYAELYNLSENDVMKAVNAHRRYGMEKAIDEVTLYDGMKETLQKIKEMGIRMAVATLKRQRIAEAMIKKYKLNQFFDVIIGMNDLENMTKSDTIKLAIKKTNAINPVMVGDSEYDYEGSQIVGISFIGVTYGFGFSIEQTYPFCLANKPSDILKLIVEGI